MAFAPTAESEVPVRIEKPDARCGEDGAGTPDGIETDPRWLCIQRLINTDSFAKASRLSSFLIYIVERFLRGRTEEITEQQIGVHVFGRPTHYNPGDDNIVRQTARQLRQRLALYYQEEGRNEPIQVVVPRGGYIPQFQYTSEVLTQMQVVVSEPAAPVVLVEKDADVQAVDYAVRTFGTKGWRQVYKSLAFVSFGLILGIAMTLFGGAAIAHLRHPPTVSDHLWNVLFTPNQRTIVVPGDAGINMYGNLAKTQIDASEYASGTYLSKPGAQTPSGFTWAPFATRRYTTLSDLTFVSSLLQLPNVNRSRMEVRFARDITFQDLKDSNAVLIGSPIYDPWIQLFDKTQNFRMVYDGDENSISVLNRKPLEGELASYKWSVSDPQRTGYALISLTDNLESSGKVLLVQGTAMGGVEAATDFLFNSRQMDPVMHDACGSNSRPSNFELLLETTMYAGGSMKAKVVAVRIHPPS